jgi:hypothetical protein
MKILIVMMTCVVLATHAFGQSAIAMALGKEAFCYTYEPSPGYSHAKQCGDGFRLDVYDLGEKLWAEYYHGEVHDDGGQTCKAIDYSFGSEIDRPFFSALASNLVAVGVHTLEQPPRETNCTVQTSLTFRVGGKKVQVTFYTPPTTGVQKVVHDLARAFGKDLWQSYPKGTSVTTQIWENATAPAREVELDYLLSHPKEFLRKRVTVEGFYHSEFECSRLSTEPNKRGIWIRGPAPDVSTNSIQWTNNAWMRATGTYDATFSERDDKPHGGHMSMSLGELVNVTQFKPIDKNGSIHRDRDSPHGEPLPHHRIYGSQ